MAPFLCIATKAREEVETRKIGRNETRTFQGLFPGCTRVSKKPKKEPDVVVSILMKLELELIQTQMAQKPMLRAEVGMRVRCANKASAE